MSPTFLHRPGAVSALALLLASGTLHGVSVPSFAVGAPSGHVRAASMPERLLGQGFPRMEAAGHDLEAAGHAVATLSNVLVGAPLSHAEAGPTVPGSQQPPGRSGQWSWPVEGTPQVVHPFDAPENRYGPGHRGLDVAGSSSTIRAVDSGTVTFAGTVAGKPVVVVRHPDGLTSTYEPVVADVAAGDEVSRGQALGTLQPSTFSHCEAGCLHVGAKRGEEYLDPFPLFGGARPSVLYPGSGSA